MALSLKAVAYFTAALRHGNIVRAAEELNISASAVSAAIDQVEDAFDLTLTIRQRSRGIEPTASGRLIARKFERLLDDYNAVLAEGADLKDTLRGELRVGYYAPIAPAFLPGVFTSFLPGQSDVVLHLEECDNDAAQDGFSRGHYDVILFVTEGARASIGFDVLIEAPPYCLMPAAHPLATRPCLHLSDIAREPLIVLNRPAASAYYRRLFETQAGGLTVAAHANSTEMVRSLVGRGLGCAVLNMQPLTATTYGGDGLIARPIADPLPPLTLAIAHDKTRPRRLVRHFVEACMAHFARPGPHRCIVDG